MPECVKVKQLLQEDSVVEIGGNNTSFKLLNMQSNSSTIEESFGGNLSPDVRLRELRRISEIAKKEAFDE